VPITCSCDETEKVLSGCSHDLFELNTCPNQLAQGPCANPLRHIDEDDLTATPFFLPCQGAAFTWPRDGANSNGECQSGHVTCCVGTEDEGCPRNPKQS
jgi:hypothetical protein